MKLKDAKVGLYVRFVPDPPEYTLGYNSTKLWFGEITELEYAGYVTVMWQDPDTPKIIRATYLPRYLELIDEDDIPMYVLANL